MKLTEFIKKLNQIGEPSLGTFTTEIRVHATRVMLEVSFEDYFIPFAEGNEFPKKPRFIALLSIDERYGIAESNFNNVPENIRSAVFETIIEFLETPPKKR